MARCLPPITLTLTFWPPQRLHLPTHHRHLFPSPSTTLLPPTITLVTTSPYSHSLNHHRLPFPYQTTRRRAAHLWRLQQRQERRHPCNKIILWGKLNFLRNETRGTKYLRISNGIYQKGIELKGNSIVDITVIIVASRRRP